MSFKVKVIREKCKGCGYCLAACAQGVFRIAKDLTARGYHPAGVEDDTLCVGCKKCTDICPDAAIEIHKEDD